jgi:hypothetical protein
VFRSGCTHLGGDVPSQHVRLIRLVDFAELRFEISNEFERSLKAGRDYVFVQAFAHGAYLASFGP